MSRTLSAANTAQIDADHLHEVIMVKLEFDTPVYVHSGIGTITYDGNSYTGIGQLGAIGAARESETLGPAPIQLMLTGLESSMITEALDSGNYKDPITIYVGYRTDGGTLVDDPWIVWKGYYEYASINQGSENTVAIVAQHDLMRLSEKDGSRFSDEDQTERYAADLFFEHITDQATIKLPWAIKPAVTGGGSYPIYDESDVDGGQPYNPSDDDWDAGT